jgi:hypothetical protein
LEKCFASIKIRLKYLDATKTDMLVKYVMIAVKLFTVIYSISANGLPLAVSGGFGTQNCQTKIKVKWNTKT